MMNKYFALFGILSLTGCGSENETDARDISTALSYADLIERRMNNDSSLDGARVLIRDHLSAFFKSYTCSPESPPYPCIDDVYTPVRAPEYQGSSLGCADGFILKSDQYSDIVFVDLSEHTDFYLIEGAETRLVDFYADISFVPRQPWCSAQVNYGLSITLAENEESHLLNQFIN